MGTEPDTGPGAGPGTEPQATPPPAATIGTAPATPNQPVVAPSEQSTADRSNAPPATVVVITAVEVRSDAGAEQIVVSSSGGTPGWGVRYVDAVRIDDEPVLTDGAAALELVLEAADPTGDQGLDPAVATNLLPDQPLVQEVRLAQHLGDTVVFAVGMSREVPFSVSTTEAAITITFHG